MHEFPRYWVPGLSALESDHQPVRIAFTYGAQQISHYAFLLPYLGGHLENHLLYVSPQRNGGVVPHHPDYLATSHPSLAVWIDALANAGATHVLCLRAPCDELTWMQDHPEVFVRLAGQAGSWGLFRIAWPTPPV